MQNHFSTRTQHQLAYSRKILTELLGTYEMKQSSQPPAPTMDSDGSSPVSSTTFSPNSNTAFSPNSCATTVSNASNAKTFACAHCPNQYTDDSNLRRHVNPIYKNKRKHCPEDGCDAHFSRSDNLRDHRIKNTNVANDTIHRFGRRKALCILISRFLFHVDVNLKCLRAREVVFDNAGHEHDPEYEHRTEIMFLLEKSCFTCIRTFNVFNSPLLHYY